MKRPWRSSTLTGTVTRLVLTRTTSPASTSSGPGSTAGPTEAAAGDPVGAVPAHCGGRAGRSGGSSAIATSSIVEAATRRGRERGSADRAVAVLLDPPGVEATVEVLVALPPGTIANGSTTSVLASDFATAAAVDGDVCDLADEFDVPEFDGAPSVLPDSAGAVDSYCLAKRVATLSEC